MNPAPCPIYFRRPFTGQHQRPHRCTGVKNLFQKPTSYFKILGSKRVTQSNFRTEGSQILGTKLCYLVPGLCDCFQPFNKVTFPYFVFLFFDTRREKIMSLITARIVKMKQAHNFYADSHCFFTKNDCLLYFMIRYIC